MLFQGVPFLVCREKKLGMLTIRTMYLVLTVIFYLLQVIAKCPEHCLCSTEGEIDCSYSSMTTFPVGDWKVMNMSHNSVLNITNSVFRNNFVEVVDFSNNIIENIQWSAFMGKLSVKEIYISWNNHISIPKYFGLLQTWQACHVLITDFCSYKTVWCSVEILWKYLIYFTVIFHQ
jgi:hypothetical protein